MVRCVILFVCILSVSIALPVERNDFSSNISQKEKYDLQEYHDPSSDISQKENDELEEYQNNHAQYEFNAEVDDRINDNQLQRSEVRDGTKVMGKYSYSDGFIKRTVHYVADEDGYRVVNEKTEDIGNGPIFNPEGQADIQGSQWRTGGYSIKLDLSNNEKHYKDIND